MSSRVLPERCAGIATSVCVTHGEGPPTPLAASNPDVGGVAPPAQMVPLPEPGGGVQFFGRTGPGE